MSKVIIRGGAVVAPDLVIPNGVILIEDGTIAAVHPTGDAALPPLQTDAAPPSSTPQGAPCAQASSTSTSTAPPAPTP